MHGGEVLIPIFICVSFFAMIFGIVYMQKRENLAMIEKGMNPKDRLNRPAPFRSLKWGLLLLGAGLGLFIAFFIDINLPYRIEPAGVYFSLIAIGGGLGLIGSYFVEKKHWYDKADANGG